MVRKRKIEPHIEHSTDYWKLSERDRDKDMVQQALTNTSKAKREKAAEALRDYLFDRGRDPEVVEEVLLSL